MPLSRRALLASSLALPALAKAQTQRINFGLNWLPQPEMGGFFEAQAQGFYAQEGLGVNFILGGPQVNNRLALVNGQVDFYLGGNLFQAFAALENKVPTVAIGAFFKKDPQCLMAHPNSATHLKELKDKPIFISKIGLVTFFPWLRAEYGFSESNVKPYLFNTQGFLADKTSLCQAYITSEPYAIKQASGLEVQSFLLDDYGFKTPSNLIEVKKEMPLALRQKFMRASQKGWESYMRDGSAGNALIKSLNPEITDAKIAFAKHELLKRDFVSDGTLNLENLNAFYLSMTKAGALKEGLNPLMVYDASL